MSIVTAAAADTTPLQPSEPVPAKAYAVFDQACASCHQSERIKVLPHPAGGIGNILDLAALARDRSLVTPGNADASPLFTAIQSRNMPPASSSEATTQPLSSTDLGAIRDWIEQLQPQNACADRPPITPTAISVALAQVIATRDAATAKHLRYISLAPLRNACATDADLTSARQAISWAINSISLGLEPAALPAVGPDNLLLEVDLKAIGWDTARWDRLAQSWPAFPFQTFDAATQTVLGTNTPLVAGDWLAANATLAPLYNDLLGLPASLVEFYATLRIDLADTRRSAAARIGLKSSTVARGNRLIERRSFANGAAWTSSEFAPTAGRPDLFDLTIASATPTTDKGERPQPHPDATVAHFALPNGFPAFFIANTTGARSNDLPQSIIHDDARPSQKVASASSCLNCHASRAVMLQPNRTDDLRARVLSETSLTKEQRDKLLALHAEPDDLARKIEEDRARFSKILAAAGIDPTRRWDGFELLPALINRYQKPVTADVVADLIGMSPEALLALRGQTDGAVANVLARLAFGTVPRAEVDAMLLLLAAKRGLRPPLPEATSPAPSLPPQLVVLADKTTYGYGDLLTLTVRSTVNCYLTVLDLSAQRRATVLYPNEFDSNNFIEAGRELRIPSEKSPYQFRLRDKGSETIVGICAATPKPVDGIQHNFEFQRFTELGDYRAFLNRMWDVRDTGEPKPQPATPRPSQRRNSESTSTQNAKPSDQSPPSPEIQLRTAITLTIE